MKQLLEELFGVVKPVIAMAHFPPLPGTPLYDEQLGVDGITKAVAKDVDILIRGGVDALLFCNEGDRPYSLKAGYESVAVMTHVVTALAPLKKPFGLDFLWADGRAAVAMAMATGASFVRGVFTGAYDSDMGFWNTDASGLWRYRREIGAQDIRLFCNITPEFASPLGNRSVGQVAKSVVVSSLADAILVSGPRAGAEPTMDDILQAKEAVGADTPILLNTGATVGNIENFLEVADGVIVGSSLKLDGYTWNPVDEERVVAFMTSVRKARARIVV